MLGWCVDESCLSDSGLSMRDLQGCENQQLLYVGVIRRGQGMASRTGASQRQ